MKIKILDERLRQPEVRIEYATPGRCAIDLRACIPEPLRMYPGAKHMIPSGIALDMSGLLSEHDEENGDVAIGAILLPLRGLGAHYGIVLANLVGLIDNDHQGQVMVELWNRNQPLVERPHEHLAHTINPMDKIAQLAFVPFIKPTFEFV